MWVWRPGDKRHMFLTRHIKPWKDRLAVWPGWSNLVHTWPPEEQSRASRKASSSTPKSLTLTEAQDAAVLMTHTHRGISPS